MNTPSSSHAAPPSAPLVVPPNAALPLPALTDLSDIATTSRLPLVEHMGPTRTENVDAGAATVLLHSDTATGRPDTLRRTDHTVVELPADRVTPLALTCYYHRRGTRTAKPPERGEPATRELPHKSPNYASTTSSGALHNSAGIAVIRTHHPGCQPGRTGDAVPSLRCLPPSCHRRRGYGDDRRPSGALARKHVLRHATPCGHDVG